MFRKALNPENCTNCELQLDDIKDEKSNVPKNVTKDVNQSPHRDVVYKDIVETNTYEPTVVSSIAEKAFPEKTSPSIEIASQN